MLNEYETTEMVEMVFLYHLGVPFEIDREIPRRVKMIFKGDLEFIKSKLDDFWSGKSRADALRLINDYQKVKRLMWVGGEYDPDFYKKCNENQDENSKTKS